MKKNKYLLLLLPVLLTSCSTPLVTSNQGSATTNTGTSISDTTSSATTSETSIIDVNPEIVSTLTYNELFNEESNVQMKLEFTNSALRAIEECGTLDNPKEDYYFPCTFTLILNEVTYQFDEVGARRKGNMSKKDDFNNGRIHYKLSFKQTFDSEEYTGKYAEFAHDWGENKAARKERKNRTLFGMEKIDLKWNRNNDGTRLRQSYTYYVSREVGILAPKTNLVNLSIKENDTEKVNEYYEILECIDDVFIKRHFPIERTNGDLYKLAYKSSKVDMLINNVLTLNSGSYSVNSSVVGIEDSTINYHPSYDLKTNKKTSKHEDLINFIKVINSTSKDENEVFSSFSSVLDLDYLAKTQAYSWAFGDPDDLRCNYNNSYLYFDPVTHKGYIIPYDHDRTMGVTLGGAGLMPSKRLSTTKCTGYGGDDTYQINPLFYRTCIISDLNDNNPGNKSKAYPVMTNSLQYLKKYLLEIKSSNYFTSTTFNSYVNKFPFKNGSSSDSSGGNNSFDEYLTNLKLKIEEDNSYLLAKAF